MSQNNCEKNYCIVYSEWIVAGKGNYVNLWRGVTDVLMKSQMIGLFYFDVRVHFKNWFMSYSSAVTKTEYNSNGSKNHGFQ
jgi:hypothetical protein